ncbi:MAG TPA: hypothetical protein PLD83_00470, partial [Oscillospiraceae bacterium]|nr:hypothetical protein [Oscillospiraceae bacterium]
YFQAPFSQFRRQTGGKTADRNGKILDLKGILPFRALRKGDFLKKPLPHAAKRELKQRGRFRIRENANVSRRVKNFVLGIASL